MKKSILLTLSISLLGLPSSQASIALFGNNSGGAGRILADAAGTPLPSGSLIRIGFFNDPVTDSAIISGTDFSAINSLFKPFGEGLPNSGTFEGGPLVVGATAGRFLFTLNGVEQSYLPANKLLHYWVFNAATTNGANQWAIFTNDDANDGNQAWLSVADLGAPGGADVTIAVQKTQVDDASDVLTGSLTANDLRTQIVVPEPSLAALILTSTALLFRRRRSTGTFS